MKDEKDQLEQLYTVPPGTVAGCRLHSPISGGARNPRTKREEVPSEGCLFPFYRGIPPVDLGRIPH